MSRDIKFRGKRLDTGEWMYGSLLLNTQFDGSALIFTVDDSGTVIDHQVDPATVGQYTGLKGKDGVEIWEGDILRIHLALTGIVEWREDLASFCTRFIENGALQDRSDHLIGAETCEVIGNIHDNPELLKEKQ